MGESGSASYVTRFLFELLVEWDLLGWGNCLATIFYYAWKCLFTALKRREIKLVFANWLLPMAWLELSTWVKSPSLKRPRISGFFPTLGRSGVDKLNKTQRQVIWKYFQLEIEIGEIFTTCFHYEINSALAQRLCFQPVCHSERLNWYHSKAN